MQAIAHIADEDLAAATPLDIDTILDQLEFRANSVMGQLTYKRAELLRAAERGYGGHGLEEEIAKHTAELSELSTQAARYSAEYARRPWNRYFLVINNNGHVHRGRNCTTCFPTTAYWWVVDLSGCDEDEMVVEYGERACTICFPDAPANPAFNAPGRRDAALIAEREMERIQRAAIKAAKTLEPELQFRNLGDWKVETVAAAKAALREVAEDRIVAGSARDTNGYYARRLVERGGDRVAADARKALAAKGVSDEDIDTIIARAEKKARKQWGIPAPQ